MSLLGTRLLVLLAILTVAVPVATVLLWSRVRGPRAVRIGTRLVMVLSAQLVAVLLAGAAINDYGYFYGSWSDLFGGTVHPATIKHVAASSSSSSSDAPHRADLAPASAGTISGHLDPSSPSRANWPRLGQLQSVTISGASSHLRSHAYIYLPPQYFQPSYANARFPAAEVFTGYPGNDLNLIRRMKYQKVLLRELDRHHARAMVLVMMRPSVSYPRDTECTDVPAGPQAQTFFAGDVPAQMSRAFRVRPTGWGAMGDSTGGYCAAKISMSHPDVFYAAVALSGYFNAIKDRTTGDLWGGSSVLRNLNDPEWRLRHMPPPPISLLVTTSPDEKGPQGYLGTRRFVSLVRAPMTVDVIDEPHGGHNFATWDAELPGALSWLSHKLPAAAP